MEKGILSYGLKVARVKPFLTGSVPSKLGHYRKISVFLCFSKILEHIIYNHIYKYLLEHKILYSKQFGFQFGHSTDHAIIQFVDQIFEAFENNFYTLVVFIAFDRVDHSIMLKKLELYSISGNNLIWIKSFHSKRKQYIEIDPRAKTSLELVNYGVPQESILAHLLFFYMSMISKMLQLSLIQCLQTIQISFTPLKIHCLFSDVNEELINLYKWFVANKFSMNVEKTKYSFFPQT